MSTKGVGSAGISAVKQQGNQEICYAVVASTLIREAERHIFGRQIAEHYFLEKEMTKMQGVNKGVLAYAL